MSELTFLARVKAAVDPAIAHIAGTIGWNKAYRALSYLRSALWVVPIVSVLLAVIVTHTLNSSIAS